MQPLVLEEELEPLLQRLRIEWWAGGEAKTLTHIAIAEPAVTSNLDVAQHAFDDRERDHAVGDCLVWQHGA